MTDKLDLPRRYRDQLDALLREHVADVEVWAYGSRVTGKSHDGSDLDLVLRSPTLEPLGNGYMDLIEALEQSSIPILVQVHDWARLPESFHQEIERNYVVVQAEKESVVEKPWVQCSLADVCSEINYGLTASASDTAIGPRFLRITDIVSGQLDWNTVPYVLADEETIAKYRLHDGDIVIARTGASTGSSFYVKNPPVAVFASYLVRLQAKPDFDSRFISYYLKSEKFWEFIRGVLGDKSAQPNASASTMTAAPFSAPKDLKEQRTIANILGTLDDKIELNRRMNQTLEEMARAIFQDWFVDFGPVHAKLESREPYLPPELWSLFPDRLVDSELGEIPEGWVVGAVRQLSERIHNGGTPKRSEPRYWEGGEIPWLTSGEVRQSFILGTQNFISQEGLAKSSAKMVPERSILVALYGATAGQVSMNYRPLSTNQAVSAIIPSVESRYFCLVSLKLKVSNLENRAVGSAQQNISKEAVEATTVLLPQIELRSAYDVIVEQLFDQIFRNLDESHTLAVQRDALLPKLVSGELLVRQ